MIVIAKKGTKKVVIGHKYEVTHLYNAPNKNRSRVYIKGIGCYSSNNFTDIGGNPLPLIDCNYNNQDKRTSYEDLKIGDIIICNSDRYVNLIKDNKYRIIDLKIITKQKAGYQGRMGTITEKKVKFEGCNRYFEFSEWKFRKLGVDESRELQLSTLLNGEEHSYSVDTSSRKIDIIKDKNLELLKSLSKSIVDAHRHELDIIDWACQKSSSSLKLKRSDYDDLLKMPLGKILKMIETK